MKLFSCTSCHSVVFFENVACTACGNVLAYLPDRSTMAALERVDDVLHVAKLADQPHYRLCANWTQHGVCNWAVPLADPQERCQACRFNEVIPPLDSRESLEAWHTLEIAKRRLFYTLNQLGLPLEPRSQTPGGLGFAFKKDEGGVKVVTGHADGLITINIAEAHAPSREHQRLAMHETYRTVLGHFRHEVSHYYWSRLIEGTPRLDAFRAMFGDERQDYSESLRRHYEAGPPADWNTSYVSAYASMHPWEDWAETCAHYLHMVDTLETARSYGLALRPAPVGGATIDPVVARRLDFDDFDDLRSAWVPLTLALNSLNRSMGLPDLYPFVLSATALEKLRFVHELLESPPEPVAS